MNRLNLNPSIYISQEKSLYFPNKCYFKKRLHKKDRLSLGKWQSLPFDLNSHTDLVSLISSFHSSLLQQLDLIAWMESQGMIIEMGQKRMGMIIDRSLRQSNGNIAKLKQNGLLDVYTRGFEKTAIYRLPDSFKNPEVWKLLQDYIPTFKKLVLGLTLFQQLLSPATQYKNMIWRNRSRSESCVLSKKNIFKYNNISIREESRCNMLPPESPSTSLILQRRLVEDVLDQESMDQDLIDRDKKCLDDLFTALDKSINKEEEEALNERLLKEGHRERI